MYNCICIIAVQNTDTPTCQLLSGNTAIKLALHVFVVNQRQHMTFMCSPPGSDQVLNLDRAWPLHLFTTEQCHC